MTRRRLLLIASLPLAIAVIIGVLAMLPARPGVTKANFDRIEKGMTFAEVEKIFGQPPAEEQWGNIFIWRIAERKGEAIVIFDNDGMVIEQRGYWRAGDETFQDKLRRWLHLD
jgi:hypothetical protein